ncbi:MAG: proton-conducting transporter membrane subunit [Pseudomonadota bacterium]|nr:proton-conducting transporter membrane subunit [Pseudomonadota bacterium]
MSLLLLLVLLLPLLLIALVLYPASRRVGLALAPWAALPGLLFAGLAPAAYVLDLPWLLLGSRFGLDETGRLFLAFTALLWLVAGFYARAWLANDPRRHVFTGFFLATLAGNLGVCLALDAASFYFAFALMTFAAYGLVAHVADARARRAGRVYLAMALLGEAMLLVGLLLSVDAAQSHFLAGMARTSGDTPLLAYVLLALGFGVKAGVPLLHMWLPLAYPAAPAPASAVLAGAMIKAGLLGWLRFLPLGEVALPELGTAMLGVGVGAAFFGVAVGLLQRDAKTVLAYSSVSQMGFLTLAVGAGLLAPQAWPSLLPAIGFYALHHALAKGALFLGEGVARRRGCDALVWAGLALPALALAGAPLSSGALAKAQLLAALSGLPAPWPGVLAWALALAAVGTALLMLRFLWLLRRGRGGGAGLLLPWLVLPAAISLLWLAADAGAVAHGLSAPGLWSAAWPLLLAVGLARLFWRRGGKLWAIPPGDVLLWLERLAAWVRRFVRMRPDPDEMRPSRGSHRAHMDSSR